MKIKNRTSKLLITALIVLAFTLTNETNAGGLLESGSIVKCGTLSTVYYVGSDQLLHPFPNRATYSTWYKNFDTLVNVNGEQCQDYDLGSNVTMKPGVNLVQFPYSKKVYAVSTPNVLRHVTSEALAIEIFGADWFRKYRTVLAEFFFNNYTMGAPITNAAEFNKGLEASSCTDINECLGLGSINTTPTQTTNPPVVPDPVPTPTPTPEPTPTPTPTPEPTPEPTPIPTPTTPNPTPTLTSSNLGINLADANYYSSNWPYKDTFKLTNPLFSGTINTWDDGRTLSKDSNGWVTSLATGQIAKTIVVNSNSTNPNAVPTGDYTILYDGEGTLTYPGATIISSSQGRNIVRVGSSGLTLYITATTPSNYVRNIRVLLPGGTCNNDIFTYHASASTCSGVYKSFEETYTSEPFHPVFLAEQRPFNTLRFMDMMQTNRETWTNDSEEPPLVYNWSDYPSQTSAHWRPIPIEVAIQLANTLGANPYFTIPHTATDDFVRQMATVVKNNLNTNLKAHIEYSNEVWNDIFDQHQWVNRQGCLLYSPNPTAECDPDGAGSLNICAYTSWNNAQANCANYGGRYYAQRTAEVMSIWEAVFGSTYPSRIVRVLGGQTGGASWRSGSQFSHLWRGTEPVSAHIDAYAIAPYFGGGISFSSVNEAFNKVTVAQNGAPANTYRLITGDPGSDGGILNWIKTDVDYLKNTPALSHIKIMAYEGGQHLLGSNSGLLLEINRDPRMKSVYEDYLSFWNNLTDSAPFIHFNSPNTWSQWGTWGSKEYQGQPRSLAPKYDALVSYVERINNTTFPDVPYMSGVSTPPTVPTPTPTPTPEPTPTPVPEPTPTPSPTPTTISYNLSNDSSYVTWYVPSDVGLNGGTMLVFGKTPNPTHGQDTSYYRQGSGQSQNAWVNAVNGSGLYYVRVCEYSSITNSCGNYSNQLEISL